MTRDMEIARRFWGKVNVVPGECWEWQAYCLPRGHGQFYDGEKVGLAHRHSYEMDSGPIPKGMVVRHLCHNPPCVNPDHLAIGMQKDNMRDMIEADRQLKGSKKPLAKLTESDIPLIRADPRPHSRIARDYDVSRSVITRVKLRDIWAHVPETNGDKLDA